MLEEIPPRRQRQDAVRQLLPMSRPSGQSGGGGSGVKPEDVKERLVGNILSGALRPNAARQILIGAGLRRRGMGIAMGLELT